MANLYLTDYESTLRKRGDTLLVEKDGVTLLQVQCHKIDTVMIFGNVQFTTQALFELCQHGIELALFNGSGTRLVAQLTSPNTKNILLRLEQFRRYENPTFRLDLARSIVTAKIENCLTLLRQYAYNHPEADFSRQKRDIKSVLRDLPGVNSIDALMGHEGVAARHYFDAFGNMLRRGLTFNGRKRRPPPDPVNALLSLGYTVAAGEIAALLDGLGFDPYLGFLHEVHYGRPSLAADLLEEFRAPLVERLTLSLINNQVLRAADFVTDDDEGGVKLEPEAFKRYFAEYERFINRPFTGRDGATTLRKGIRLQAERLVAHIGKGQPYQPFTMVG